MAKIIVSILALTLLHHGLLLEAAEVVECNSVLTKKQGFSMSIQSKRNDAGKWVTTFVGNRIMDNNTDLMDLDLKHDILECDGKQIFQIQGITSGTSESYNEALTFHSKCGKNVAVTNNGRTIQKLNAEDRINAVVFTNRLLKVNELFEVTIERKVDKLGYFMGIGVTTLSPNEMEIPAHMNSMKTGTWMLYHNHVFNNGSVLIKENVQHLDKLQVGNRVGLMRSNSGTLHLYVNGADLGPVASNIPLAIFGVFEFYGDLAQVSLTK